MDLKVLWFEKRSQNPWTLFHYGSRLYVDCPRCEEPTAENLRSVLEEQPKCFLTADFRSFCLLSFLRELCLKPELERELERAAPGVVEELRAEVAAEML